MRTYSTRAKVAITLSAALALWALVIYLTAGLATTLSGLL